MCCRNLETAVHLFWECPIVLQVWKQASRWQGCSALDPASWPPGYGTKQRWADIWEKTKTIHQKGVKELMIIIVWEVWLERNRRIFTSKIAPVNAVIQFIRTTLGQWRIAGAKCLQHPFGEPG